MARRREKRGGSGVRWVTVLIGAIAVLLVVVVVGVLGLRGWLNAYLAGEEFRMNVSARVSEIFVAQGEFEEIVWTGSSAYSDGFAATGYEDAPFSTIGVNGIRANLNLAAVRQGLWDIPGIDVNKMSLVMKRENRLRGNAPVAAVTGEGEDGMGFLQSMLPTRVEIGEIKVADTALVATLADGGRISLSGVETRMRPLTGDDAAWSVSGSDGTMTIPGLPEFEIDSFTTRLRGGNLFVTDAAFAFLDGARLTGSGEMRFGDEREIDLKMKLADLDTKEVLAPGWKEKVSGHLHGDVDVILREGEGLRKEGELRLTKGVVEGLGVLDKVADYAKAERFRRLVLHEATADFVHAGDRLEITNLVLQSDGLTRLTGDMVIEGGMVSGTFRVGVTPGTLKWIPGAEQKVFVDLSDGFLWTQMAVVGPVENPSEDLSDRLMAAAMEQVVEDVIGTVVENPDKLIETTKDAVEAGKGLLDSATEGAGMPSDALIDEGKRILDTLTPFLR